MEDGNNASEQWRNRIASLEPVSTSLTTESQQAPPSVGMIETTFSPFHCLYNDALHFHTESRLKDHESRAEGSRYARAALTLYLDCASALVHQAAVELGRPEL